MPRSEHVLLAIVFSLSSAAMVAGAVTHEPWWDEAQAWLIARDAPIADLFTHVVRYEGHPPLWYLLLAIPARLGLPYASMKVVAVLGGAASAFLLLYAFPRIPVFLRVLAPFAFYIAYQYTVVARSYVLVLPLLLLIARHYDRRSERPGLYALLLILLSHVSVHGFAVACALAALFLWEIARKKIPRPPRRAFLIATAAFAANAVLLVLLLWPPADNRAQARVHSPLDVNRHAQVILSVVPPLFWPPLSDETPVEAALMALAATAALTLLIVWYVASGAGPAVLAAALGVYAVALRYFSMWHEGLFFFVLLFGAAIAFGGPSGGRTRWRALDVAAQVVLVLLLLRHAQWTFQSLGHDLRWEATGSARAAEFIKSHGLHTRQIYGTGPAVVELQPYFAANIFDNYQNDGRAYWEWSSKNTWPYTHFTPTTDQEITRWFDGLVGARPEYIVYGSVLMEPDSHATRLFRDPSYRRIGSFGGYTYWKNHPNWLISFHVFERVTPRPPTGRPGA